MWQTFRPLPGFSSSHLQTILPAYLPAGREPPTKQWLVAIGNGDFLSCEVSTPERWQETVVLVHGLGGSAQSNYMVRLARKFYTRGYKVVRVNLRGCGSGKGLSKLPYHAGTSGDLLAVLEALLPTTSLHVVGFSLGANVVLKLAGELGSQAKALVKSFAAICPPIDLAKSVQRIEEKRHCLYHAYYLKKILAQATAWNPQNISSIYEFDDRLTARLWGYQGADDYYQVNSSLSFLEKIEQTTYLLFSGDDPFISTQSLEPFALPAAVHLYKTTHGGHMGFLGRDGYWLDKVLSQWICGR